ncbi:MAG: hypothetical protein CMO80_08780 [Verrucomicrobiales bacterium]|nr:hypothetical protein [Verrucomicrobiales bacterium]|tara:strand:- start:1058 stop:1357 length:300 start_codon:yes stop_codon:yes gene_type:complete
MIVLSSLVVPNCNRAIAGSTFQAFVAEDIQIGQLGDLTSMMGTHSLVVRDPVATGDPDDFAETRIFGAIDFGLALIAQNILFSLLQRPLFFEEGICIPR